MFISKNRRILIALCVHFFISAVYFEAKAQDVTVTAGPAVGETVDLLSFKSRSGQTLAQTLKTHSLAMLLLVDPNCGTCVVTKDNINALRDRVQKTSMDYFIVMISDGSDAQKYFDFADSLKLGVDAYLWTNPDAKPPASLMMMTKPSHLQVTSEGLIVQKWSGTPPKDAGQ